MIWNRIKETPPPRTGECIFLWDEDSATDKDPEGDYPRPVIFEINYRCWRDWYYGTEIVINDFTHWAWPNNN